MRKLNEKYSFDESNKISSGGCGDIYPIEGHDDLVVKICRFEKYEKKENHSVIRAKRFDEEINFLNNNKFIFAPKIYDFHISTKKNNKSWYIMEKCIPLIKAEKSNKDFFNIRNKLIICLKLLDYIEILHRKNIAHRDIKPSNILFRKYIDNENLLLSDYGLVKTDYILYSEYGGQMGSNTYTAPEARYIDKEYKTDYYFKSDIYSYVKTVWSIIKMKEYSFNYDTDLSIDENLFSNENIDGEKICFEPIYEMIDRGISSHSEQRPTIEECRNYINMVLSQIENPIYNIEKSYVLKNILRDLHIRIRNSSIKIPKKCFLLIEKISKLGNFSVKDNELIEYYDKDIKSDSEIYYIFKYIKNFERYYIKFEIGHIIIDENSNINIYVKNVSYSKDNINYFLTEGNSPIFALYGEIKFKY